MPFAARPDLRPSFARRWTAATARRPPLSFRPARDDRIVNPDASGCAASGLRFLDRRDEPRRAWLAKLRDKKINKADRNTGERADIYALGVILYEMVTGVPPYSRGDHMSVMYQHVQGKARIAQELNPALPPGLSDLVMKSMTVDKTKRFQSMDELRIALEKYL